MCYLWRDKFYIVYILLSVTFVQYRCYIVRPDKSSVTNVINSLIFTKLIDSQNYYMYLLLKFTLEFIVFKLLLFYFKL